MKSFDMQEFSTELEKLIEAKKLLDYIICHHDPYTGQFSKISEWDADYSKIDSMCDRIRQYKKFDDSE